ncbi:MAG: cation-translocating P-type ATPase [Alphaproteobacteria bacterium]|nr:cation-translocating P-type ATPase [Alphaproteobacteria bacterium]
MPETTQGLSAAEAARRLATYGYNELPHPDRRNFVRIAFEVVRQPMFALLLGGGVIYLLLGEAIDAVVLLIFATLSVSISIVQESRSERVLEALRNLASPRAIVLRDGRRIRIPGREVVPGDVIVLAEGDRVPADAILTDGHDLLVDESLLTGESVPVRKRPAPEPAPPRAPPGGDDLPFVFAGTLVSRGSGTACVTATGLRSEMGKIGQALRTITLEQPRLQTQLGWLVRDFALLGLAVSALAVLLFGILRGSWLKAALGGIAIGMSVMPEEVPLVLAVFMAMGAWRISRARVLTRRAAAIETLGSATVLCTDKTGTLTENRMRVELVATDRGIWRRNDAEPPPNIQNVLSAALGASAALPTDPMDRAIHEAAAAGETAAPRRLLQSYGIRPDLFATTNIWSEKDGVAVTAYAKGAPETIAELCRLPEEGRAALLRQVDKFAAQGVRLLAVAKTAFVPAADGLPSSPRDIPFAYMGLVGFADPLRANVPAAVRECGTAGIRVVMITGDYPATARAIAAQAGIDGSEVLSGDDLDALSDADLAEKMKSISVFARIRPRQKLRIVEALKTDGEIVAMTGDGVNDAPAMKAAHIGIAMGGRGTDVAREAAALVLLDDDFASIVTTIRLGRRIYDNLRKAIQYIVAVHVPIAGLALLPFLFGLPLMLMPVQIALLEMVIDPACSVVFESETEETAVMRRPPRNPATPALPGATALWAALQGLAALAAVGLALFLGARVGMAEADLRAFVFTTLVLMNIGLILVNRSFKSSLADAFLRPNRALWALVSAVLLVLAVALYWTPAQNLFHFGPLHLDDLSVCLAAGAALIGFLEIGKRLRRGPDG